MEIINQNYLSEEMKAVQTALMTKVYKWMSIALALTGVTAWLTASNNSLMSLMYSNHAVIWGIFIAQIALVIIMSARVTKMSLSTLTALYLIYSLLTGLTLSSIFFVYTTESIASCFLITSVTFAAMSIYGAVTKRDLTSIGNICFAALIGIIIASIVNIFMASSTLAMIVNYLAVIIFVGLTAYDTQKIKSLITDLDESEASNKVAIMGALTLYLDFINLFIYLLRIMGNRRN